MKKFSDSSINPIYLNGISVVPLNYYVYRGNPLKESIILNVLDSLDDSIQQDSTKLKSYICITFIFLVILAGFITFLVLFILSATNSLN